jgi:ferredoxin
LSKQKLNLDKRVCGICVSVCPIGKKNISAIGIDNESQN